ncbi:MAG: HisA/HisF-related TIM barrel protein [Candidatus Thiodiazotropha sp.]
MKLIPVIDVMHGHVVTAKRGERQTYAPSNTPLCRSSRPGEVIAALLALHPFDTLYIADLDAILSQGSNSDLIRRLAHEHPDVTFWVDDGLMEPDAVSEFARPVIGTESLVNSEQLAHLLASLPSPVLSLDYLGERFLGPVGLDLRPDRWPEDVIAMTLSRVGANSGPDLTRLQSLSARRTDLRLYAAGGIRNPQDLERLGSIGAAGALLSTALHQGTIDSMALDRFLSS